MTLQAKLSHPFSAVAFPAKFHYQGKCNLAALPTNITGIIRAPENSGLFVQAEARPIRLKLGFRCNSDTNRR